MLPIRDDALGDLADQDEEEDEGEEPAQVVSWEVQPGAVVDVHLGALAAPTCSGKRKNRIEGLLDYQESRQTARVAAGQSWLQGAGRLCYHPFNHILGILGIQKAASLDFSEPRLLFNLDRCWHQNKTVMQH